PVGAIAVGIVIFALVMLALGAKSGQAARAGSSARSSDRSTARASPSAGASTVVPDVSGYSLADARASLKEAGFSVGNVRYVLGTPGLVVQTRPAAGMQWATGDAVNVLIGESSTSSPDNSAGGGN